MKNIIENVSLEIAKEIITRPNFDVKEISGIINFRIKESLLDILLSNVEKEEVIYHRLLIEQSNNRVGTSKYVETGYKLAMAKNKKAIANRAVHNAKNKTKLAIALNHIRDNYKHIDLDSLYKAIGEGEVSNG
jgi:hypothetical protein